MSNFYTGGGSRTSSQLVGTTDFFLEVAKGTVLGHSIFIKYGRNPDIDAATTPADIWTYGGIYTYNDTPSIQYLSSDDALDIGMQITVEGLDANYNEQSVTVVLNGQNQTQIGTGETFVRVFRAYTSGPIEFAGNVLIYDDTVVSVTLGVPSPTTSVKAEIRALDQQTYMTHFTVPAGKTAYLVGRNTNIETGASANKSAIVDLRVREFGGVFRSKELEGLTTTGSSIIDEPNRIPFRIPEKSDIKICCREVSSNDTGISARYSLILVEN